MIQKHLREHNSLYFDCFVNIRINKGLKKGIIAESYVRLIAEKISNIESMIEENKKIKRK